jgi:serine/threonine protein kinase
LDILFFYELMGCASSMPNVDETVVKNSRSIAESVAESAEDFHAKYILGSKLGRGAFGHVRIATPASKRSNANVEDMAVKILDLRHAGDLEKVSAKAQRSSLTEASMWLMAKHHANVVQLREVFYDSQLCYFVMEKCGCGLFRYMECLHELNERSVGNIFAQMLQGVAHVHSAGVVHRDIKADNFLVGGDDGSTVKLTDFGLSAALPRDGKLKGCYGTAPYMSPEMLKGDCYDTKTDVWSVAVVAYTLLFGAFPYTPKEKTAKAMKQAIIEGKSPTFKPARNCTGTNCMGRTLSEDALLFVALLLNRLPALRPCAVDALKLPYMLAVTRKQRNAECALPSLRPMLYSAKKAGAFEERDLTKVLEIDGLLEEMQRESRVSASPDSQSRDIFCDPKNNINTSVPSDSFWHSTTWSKVSSVTTASGESWRTMSSFTGAPSGNSNVTNYSPKLSPVKSMNLHPSFFQACDL